MGISSRTPEGEPQHCPVCHQEIVIDPSQPLGDAPCPHCGCLLYFVSDDKDIRLTGSEEESTEHLIYKGLGFLVRQPKTMYVCPGCKTRIPFGTKSNPPPTVCPSCQSSLHIPTLVGYTEDGPITTGIQAVRRRGLIGTIREFLSRLRALWS
jgi:hypothetical protein